MRVLVTGGGGFIGSAIARASLTRGWHVTVLDNFLTGFRESVPADAELLEADLRNIDALRKACAGVEVVFHQGALRSVPRSVEDPLLSAGCNVTGTLNVLIAAESAGSRRVIYASSSSVYGDSEEQVNSEVTPPDPISPYAVSKLAGEHYCRVWSRLKQLSTVSLRYFNVFGPGQHPESKYAAVFPAFVSALAAGRQPEVHWDGEQSRDFTFIDDVVRANILAATADDRVSGAVINIGGGRPKTINEVLSSISRAMGRWIDPIHAPKRSGDVRHTRADITRAVDLLGWTPQTAWDEAVKATIDWFNESEPRGKDPSRDAPNRVIK
jgi:UDP-N-acetylglucosamine/UDP-N-acetyl-alpha-D-glucosaminouronate 4-epimerase